MATPLIDMKFTAVELCFILDALQEYKESPDFDSDDAEYIDSSLAKVKLALDIFNAEHGVI